MLSGTIFLVVGVIFAIIIFGVFFWFLGFETTKVVYNDYTLKKTFNVVTLYKDGNRIFSTPFSWSVTSADLGDADGDGEAEMVLAVRRLQAYGGDKVAEEDLEETAEVKMGSHVEVYDLEPSVELLWGSTKMEPPISKIGIVNDSNRNLFNVTETNKWNPFAIFSGNDSVWSWDEWVFKKVED